MAQLDSVPAMLKPGEYVVRKEAVDKLGKETMDIINNADRLGYSGGGLVPQGQHGHSAIDELLALNTLNVQRNIDMTRQSSMMQKGGEVSSLILPGTGDLISKTVPLKGSNKQISPKSLGLIPSLLMEYKLSNEPEPIDRLTPEEEILLELLTQSNKSEASVSPPMLGEVNPFPRPYRGEMKPPMVEEKPIRSPFKAYQEGGEAGLQYAEDYEYSPSGFEKILDALPFIGGKRAYDRAEKYIKDVHWNPEDEKIRDAQMKRKSNVFGKASAHYMEENDLTTKDDFQQRTFVETDEDPRNFGYRNIAEKNNLTNINQFIHGSPSGHIMETDDTQDYAVDPYNIAKSSEDYKGILGMLGIPRYSGSVKKNPGIGAYIDPSYFKEQVMQTDAQKLQQGGLIEDKGKRKGGYSLGVKDELAESVDYFQDLDKILSAVRHQDRYDFGKSERSTIDWLGESGIMDVESALKHLDHIQKRYHEGTVGFHMPRYQGGGIANYQNGGYNPQDSIEQYYDIFGFKPTDEDTLKQFEKLYAYDPSEAVGDIGELRTDLSGELGKATADTASYGMGFAGFGGRQESVDKARESAQREYETGSEKIMETSRAEAEADALQFLAGLQQGDASMEEFSAVDPTKTARSFQPGASITGFTFPENPEDSDTVSTPRGMYYVYNASTGLWEQQN